MFKKGTKNGQEKSLRRAFSEHAWSILQFNVFPLRISILILHNISKSLRILPRKDAWRAGISITVSLIFIGFFFGPAGPLGEYLYKNFMTFYRIFRPAEPLGGLFHTNFMSFYRLFLPNRSAWRVFTKEFHDIFIGFFAPGPLGGHFHNNF